MEIVSQAAGLLAAFLTVSVRKRHRNKITCSNERGLAISVIGYQIKKFVNCGTAKKKK